MLLLLNIAPTFATTNTFEIVSGTAIQGGMIVLKTDLDAAIFIDGENTMLSVDGFFVTGFHRDDKASITITAHKNNAIIARMILTPTERVYKEQRINGLPSQMVTPPDEVLTRIAHDRDIVMGARNHATALPYFSRPFDWPVQGVITGVYGARRILNDQPRAPHYGVDIAATIGTPVRAPQGGIIRMVEDLYFTGWTAIIDHGHGVSSTFLHLDTIIGSIGDAVEKGDVIGTVGSTGRSTGAHLDWRVNLFQKRLDPALIVGEMPN